MSGTLTAAPPKPRLLFLTPVEPCPTQTGLAMRAWRTRAALSCYFHVTSVVLQRQPPVLGRCQRVVHNWFPGVYPWLYPRLYPAPLDWPRDRDLREAFHEPWVKESFDRVHVFRLKAVPYAAPFLGKVPCQLDLDESEVTVRQRLADLARLTGDRGQTQLFAWERQFYQRAEERNLPLFNHIFVSSAKEGQTLQTEYPELAWSVLPNCISLPERDLAPAPAEPWTVLFVGNQHYYPNQDAVLWFAKQVLPELRRLSRSKIRFLVAGLGPARIKEQYADAGVDWVGYAEDLAPLYQQAQVVVAPLRAGGGTRIKILEAFSYRRPVVATAQGAEGLDTVAGEHLLLADTVDEFAECCLNFFRDPRKAAAIADSAHRWVRTHHSPEILRQRLSESLTPA